MTENQKDTMATGNPTNEQNQVKKTNEDNQQKGNAAQKSSTMINEDDKNAIDQKEIKEKEHQHEYKTPTGEQNRNVENQAQKPAFDANKNPNSKPAAEQKA